MTKTEAKDKKKNNIEWQQAAASGPKENRKTRPETKKKSTSWQIGII